MWIDLGGLAAAGVFLPLLLRLRAEAPGRERVAYAAELRASVVEGVQGMAELIVLGAVEEHTRHIDEAGRAVSARQLRLGSMQGVGEAGLVAAGSLAVWAAAFVLAPRIAQGTLPAADFAMLTVFVLASFEAIMPLPAAIQRAGEMAAAARRLFELIDQAPAVIDPDPIHAASPPAAGCSLGLRVRDLRFRYSEEQRWIFDGLSFQVRPGSRVGLVGPTGVGKSTLVNILLRFWDYQGGSLEVMGDGAPPVELRALSGERARALFSVMPQAPHLFHATIRENLLLASAEKANPGDEALFSALEAAGLADFIRGLPEGLATTVGELGRELSIGQVRRVALARAAAEGCPRVHSR